MFRLGKENIIWLRCVSIGYELIAAPQDIHRIFQIHKTTGKRCWYFAFPFSSCLQRWKQTLFSVEGLWVLQRLFRGLHEEALQGNMWFLQIRWGILCIDLLNALKLFDSWLWISWCWWYQLLASIQQLFTHVQLFRPITNAVLNIYLCQDPW